MTPADPSPVHVAPREIHDLVYYCCRVCGLDPGNAHAVAEHVVDGEIVGRKAAAGFVEVMEASSGDADLFRGAVEGLLDPRQAHRDADHYRHHRHRAMTYGLALTSTVLQALTEQSARFLTPEAEIEAAVQ